MTTIILTIIGILLAAAAALMVIFYGGDAFNGGSIGAQANTYQNAGTNVVAAIQLAKADGQVDVTTMTSPSELQGVGDLDYLKELPALPNGTAPALATTATGTRFSVTVGGTDAAKICTRINTNLKSATPTAVTEGPTVKMGCDNTSLKFFANA